MEMMSSTSGIKSQVLTQSKPVFHTAVRPVSTVVPKLKVTRPRLAHLIITKSKSPIKRHITRSPSPKTSNSPPRVTAVQAPVVSAAQGMQGKWIGHHIADDASNGIYEATIKELWSAVSIMIDL
nr:hypothetical protein [Tanacetum cinerariifolium]